MPVTWDGLRETGMTVLAWITFHGAWVLQEYGSALVTTIALVAGLGAWLYPRQPKKTPVPDFTGVLESSNVEAFAKFIRANEDRVVRIRIAVPMDEEEIWSEDDDDEGRQFHGLTLKNKEYEGLANGGLEISIEPERGSKSSPMLFANGSYHLNGFFVVRMHPGTYQGWISGTITELSAEQLALRS